MNQYQQLKLDHNCVYIYKGCNLEVIIHCDDGSIVGESLLQQSGPEPAWCLYCLTDSGHIYRVTSTQAKHANRQADQEDNQEIFSDLLVTGATEKEDEHGVSVHPSPSRPVHILHPDNRVLSLTQTAVGMCVLPNLLSVVIDEGDKYLIYLYEIAEEFKDGISLSKEAKFIECHKRLFDLKDKRNSSEIVIKGAVLVCETETEYAVHSTDQIALAEGLFIELFGKDAYLLNVPVVLLALPEGSVYCVSTKSFMFPSTHKLRNEPFELVNTSNDDDLQVDLDFKTPAATRGSVVAIGNNTAPSGDWRLLCDTASQVIDIVQVSLSGDPKHDDSHSRSEYPSSEVGYQDTLVVCCRSGLVLVYFAGKHDKAGIRVSKIMGTSPTVAVKSFGNRLYLSTDLQVNETSLFVRLGKKDRKSSVYASETKTFKYAGVSSLVCYPEQGYVSHQDSPCHLTCATSQGQMKVIKSADFGSDVTMVTGNQIRDVLLAMDSVDVEKRAVQKVLQDQDQLLQQVNVALNLRSRACSPCEGCSTSSKNLLDAPHKVTMCEKRQDKPGTLLNIPHSEKAMSCAFCCYTTARSYSAHGENRLQLDVNITNQTGVSLSCDWRFVATVSSHSSTLPQNAAVSVSQTLHEEFKPKESFVLHVCIRPEMVLNGCTVSVVAMLCLKDSFDWLDSDKTLPDRSDEVRCLTALIYREEIDVLHFLMPNTFESKQVGEGKDTSAAIRRSILKIAEKKPLWNVYKEGSSKDPACSLTVCLAHFRHITQPTYEQLQTQYSKDVCSVLQYLLQTSPCVPPPAGTDCSLVTMLGQPVHLSVTTNMAAALAPAVAMETKVMTVEVKVRAEAATAAAVHAAVARKMKGLEREACRPPVHVRDLKKSLHSLQEFQEELQSLSCDQDTSKLTSLYEKLRSIQVA